eukprot:gb/GEZJ01006461.1/.p1 GENE.gb/GEZJ01006461.1/~~gb/GEZJ01006461.1/.p1  ORF type:complete len:100 (+),score=7.30 gb/GEZJ01006461.1/:341-640(+)
MRSMLMLRGSMAVRGQACGSKDMEICIFNPTLIVFSRVVIKMEYNTYPTTLNVPILSLALALIHRKPPQSLLKEHDGAKEILQIEIRHDTFYKFSTPFL